MMMHEYKRLHFDLLPEGEETNVVAFHLHEVTEFDDTSGRTGPFDRRRAVLTAGVTAGIFLAAVASWWMLSRDIWAPRTIRVDLSDAKPVSLSNEAFSGTFPEAALAVEDGSLDGGAFSETPLDLPAPPAQNVLPVPDGLALSGATNENQKDIAPAPRPGAAPALIFDSQGAPEPIGQNTVSPTQIRTGNGSTAAAAAHVLRKNTLLSAILETPIDSGKAGGVRALITTDIRSSDGRTLLVPRSSRLIGQYQGQADRAGQGANVIWVRLLRPDGSAVNLHPGNIDNDRFAQEFGRSSLVSTIIDSGNGAQDASSSRSGFRFRSGEPIGAVVARDVRLAATN